MRRLQAKLSKVAIGLQRGLYRQIFDLCFSVFFLSRFCLVRAGLLGGGFFNRDFSLSFSGVESNGKTDQNFVQNRPKVMPAFWPGIFSKHF
jgi:hypothetical protein